MGEQEYGQAYTEYQANRGALRKLVRQMYIRSARKLVQGATIDFGCGIGELLSVLPAGSIGLEYNKATVDHCQRNGLDVRFYDGFDDGWQLGLIPDNAGYESMVISHVLEHFEEPMSILEKLLVAADRINVRNVLVIVPGPAGYRYDPTHRTFVDLTMVEEALAKLDPWRLAFKRYFPFPFRAAGHGFAHNELQILIRNDTR